MNLKLLKREIETDGSAVRFTKAKCSILGVHDYDKQGEQLTFTKSKGGIVKVKWMGRIMCDTQETARCDMGHVHHVQRDKHWVWNYCELDRKDIDRLIEFLT